MQVSSFANKVIYLCSVVLFVTSLPVFSQTPKGIILEEQSDIVQGKTRALIIGISKYAYIDSLQYADQDAMIFADYLRNSKFWNIDKDDITLLVNDKAKYGDLTVQLQRLFLESDTGDQFLFYFSGHGDVETKTLLNRGFLLAQDTYSNNYMANGLRVDDLKDIFVRLLAKKIKVIVITDACRSGNLAGGVEGVKLTALAISVPWKNEIKILSSLPEQFSYEDKKWGGGRGVFSYFLINGLKGAADANQDSVITLKELENYVEGNVARETGNQQVPKFEGPNKYETIITRIGSARPPKGNKSGGDYFGTVHKKLILTFDSCDLYYQDMMRSIDENKLIAGDNNAITNYQRLKTCSNDSGYILRANADLLSALMNSSQEIINNSFIGKNFVTEKQFTEGIELIEQILKNNDLKLPLDKHLTNLKRYLKVQSAALWDWRAEDSELALILDSAMKEEPDAAYLLSAKGILELRGNNYTNAIKTLENATEKSPSWLIPKYYLGVAYSKKKNYKKALDLYKEVLQKDTATRTFECAQCILKNIYEYEKKLERIDFDKYKDDVKGNASLDSARNSLYGNSDSAYFYFNMGKRFDKKNHPYQDSVYFFYTQAVLLDPYESEYMYGLYRYLRKKSYGETEIREWLRRSDDYDEYDQRWFLEALFYSFFYSKELENAFNVAVDLFEKDLYDCANMKKLNKKLNKLPAYQVFIKEHCSD